MAQSSFRRPVATRAAWLRTTILDADFPPCQPPERSERIPRNSKGLQDARRALFVINPARLLDNWSYNNWSYP
jgi:hypothetical protein